MSDKYTPDQPIVKGADVIYRPAGNAGEYAPLATNPWRGCGHGCAYCYVPNATHIQRAEFNEGAVLREGYMDRLRKDVTRHAHLSGGPAEQIFITFSSDPFHRGDLEPTAEVMNILQTGGLAFCTLSKGGARALRFMPWYRPRRDAYACTLTTLNDDFSRKWEPNAALPHDRIATLKAFHDRGIFTWVSLEPTLDIKASLAIIEKTHRFVDLYKIGKANYLKAFGERIDWAAYAHLAVNKCDELDKKFYIKRDLQRYLPEDILARNPLRVTQHH